MVVALGWKFAGAASCEDCAVGRGSGQRGSKGPASGHFTARWRSRLAPCRRDRYNVGMTHFADRLAAAVRSKRTALCVGLDPRLDSLPRSLRERHSSPAAAFEEFCLRTLDIVAPLVAIVKPQSAFFEAYGPDG